MKGIVHYICTQHSPLFCSAAILRLHDWHNLASQTQPTPAQINCFQYHAQGSNPRWGWLSIVNLRTWWLAVVDMHNKHTQTGAKFTQFLVTFVENRQLLSTVPSQIFLPLVITPYNVLAMQIYNSRLLQNERPIALPVINTSSDNCL